MRLSRSTAAASSGSIKYRRYDDVRLVFAPEADIAAFGGDPDNFQFPRWCLDISLLRAYENGRPAATPQHLTIDFDGPAADEPVFVAGHPGSTDRQLTVAELTNLRDRILPPALLRASELRGRYIQFGKTDAAANRIVQDALFGLENGIKVQRKQLDALLDDALLAAKTHAESDLRQRASRNRALAAEIGDPWARIEAAQAVRSRALAAATNSSRAARASTAACSATRARSCAAPPSGRSRTPIACASSRTASCRASSSSSRRRCRSIPSSSASRCPSRSSACASGSAPTPRSCASCSRPNRPTRSRRGSSTARSSRTRRSACSSGTAARPRSTLRRIR